MTMTFEELKQKATEQGATYVTQLDEQTQGELLIMAQAVFDDMPWWDKDDFGMTASTLEEEMLQSKVTDLEELFKMYWELQARAFCSAMLKLANSTRMDDLEDYLSCHFETWFKRFITTPEGLISELQQWAE